MANNREHDKGRTQGGRDMGNLGGREPAVGTGASRGDVHRRGSSSGGGSASGSRGSGSGDSIDVGRTSDRDRRSGRSSSSHDELDGGDAASRSSRSDLIGD